MPQTPAPPQKSLSECLSFCTAKEAGKKGLEALSKLNPYSAGVFLVAQIGNDVYDAYQTGDTKTVSTLDNAGQTIGFAYIQREISNRSIFRGLKSVFSQRTAVKLGKTILNKAPIVGTVVGAAASLVSVRDCVKDCMAGK